MSDSLSQQFWLGISAFAAGVINSVAGGGTLLTFPALLTALNPLGVEAGVFANATSTVALVPGSLAGAWGYRREMRAARSWTLILLGPSLIGGLVGSLLLTRLEAKYFQLLVPWLILTAALLFMLQPAVARLIQAKPHAAPSRNTVAAIVIFQFFIAIYGGYFGAGIGILMLSALALMGVPGVHQMNAVKTFLAFCINSVSVLIFVVEKKVEWRYAPIMAVSAIMGGYLGARVARRVRPQLVRWFIIAVGLGLASYYFYQREEPVPPSASPEHARVDPRLSYAGPYRNIDPDVGYVGDASCLSCHPKETASFRQHPMGRSLLPIAQVAPQQVYDKQHNNPFQALGSQFVVERQGDRVWHRQKRQDAAGNPLVDYAMEVHYAIGSGRGGYSYLTDRDGYLFQTPISWFSQKQIWDLSPSFDSGSLAGRPVDADCLFCHANRAHALPGYKNRYEEPIFDGCVIGCERCHGPGARHIESAEKLDIVNPKKLTAALADAVCEQCHLTGVRVLPYGRQLYDFRPGLPLDEFFSVFVYASRPGEKQPAVTHVEQMHESRCYQGSSGEAKLRCATCHNPHQYVGSSQRVANYRASCLACHEKQGCSLPRAFRLRTSKEDSCIDCHMPRQSTTDVPHTAATDHRIVRSTSSKPAQKALRFDTRGDWLLKPFGGRRVDPGNRKAERDLGIALTLAAGRGLIAALPAADQALVLFGRGPADEDSDAWEAKGLASLVQNDSSAAQAAFEKALSLQPQREDSLAGAARAASDVGQLDAALSYSRRVVAANPWIPVYRKQLAFLLRRKQLWDEVRSQCQAWMRLDPSNAEARMLWVSCLIRAGDKDKARQEFARLEALQPPNLDQFRAIFANQMR